MYTKILLHAVGAGQCGLTLAARLWQNGVNALVLEKDAKVGDIWRKRYPSLKLHSQYTATSSSPSGMSRLTRHQPYSPAPASMSSFLYQPYPSTFPEFISRDRCVGLCKSDRWCC